MRYRAMIIIVVVMTFFFTTAGWALYKAFEKSVEQSANSTMEAYIVSLLSTMDFIDNTRLVDANVNVDPGEVVFDSLPLPQLARPNSGVYAEIWDDKSLLWRSNSLIGKPLPRMPALMGEYRFYPNESTTMGLANLLTFGVEWQEEDLLKHFEVVVAVDALPYQKRLSGYSKTLLTWLFVIGVLLLLLQLIFFSFLFRPLFRVVSQLNEIELGERADFDTNYPQEVLVLTSSFNAYIEHEKKQIAKQKSSLSNLAHALKTPLAVIRGALSSEPIDSDTAEQQLDVMSDSIEYQLNKANSLSRQRFQKPIQCQPRIASIVSALTKLYTEKGVEILVDIEEGCSFFGDEGDLLEVIGNLLENACKWCDKRVFLIAKTAHSSNSVNRAQLSFVVLDDGPGIEASQRELIVQRGKRLDEKVKGHGIGLSIVNDIVSSYGGKLDFLDAKGELIFKKSLFTLTSGLKVTVTI